MEYCGLALLDDDHDTCELIVHFDGEEWFESHGLPGPEETGFEVTDECYELDGKSISYSELVELFGQKEVDRAIDWAIDDGLNK